MDMIEHRVRERAYYIWEGEGRADGRADAHWFQAEAEFAAASPEIASAATLSASEVATKAPARAKAAAPKAPAKAAAVRAPKAAAPKAPAKPRKTPRAEAGIALH